jgi:hypothetical protein
MRVIGERTDARAIDIGLCAAPSAAALADRSGTYRAGLDNLSEAVAAE